ncbi:MAG: hypothetical protein ACR2N5_03295 [Solirubrobacterales bacterium]
MSDAAAITTDGAGALTEVARDTTDEVTDAAESGSGRKELAMSAGYGAATGVAAGVVGSLLGASALPVGIVAGVAGAGVHFIVQRRRRGAATTTETPLPDPTPEG